MAFVPCHSRREIPGQPQLYFCAHPKMMVKGNVVTRSICRQCKYCHEPPPNEFLPYRPPPFFENDGPCFYLGEQSGTRDCRTCRGSVKLKVFQCHHPAHQETTYEACKHCRDYTPQLDKGSVSTWVVGLLAASGEDAHVDRTQQSLARAGWPNTHVFDVASAPAVDSQSPNSRIGTWGSWVTAIMHLLWQEPYAQAYLITFDGVVFCKGLRSFLQRELWPAGDLGFVSLTGRRSMSANDSTDTSLTLVKGGWDSAGVLDERMPNIGAVVLPNPAARALVSHAAMRAGHLESTGVEQVARGLRHWCRASSLAVHHWEPALAGFAPIEPGDKGGPNASAFVGVEFDAEEAVGQAGNPD
ncbi:MAG: hypothetical protein WDZ59_07935 [Pirellulales bacterium]